MRVAVDINHPGHVHFFKHFIWEMKKRGHHTFVSAIDKDLTHHLLDHYRIKYFDLGKHSTSFVKKMMMLPALDLKYYTAVRPFNPDILMGLAAIRTSHASFFLKKPCLSFDDTEHAATQIALYRPFADSILTPTCFTKYLGKNQIRYPGYHELAYLHPNRFTPDPSVLDEIGVAKDEKFAIIRFVSWGASHDVIHSGFSDAEKIRIVKEVEKYATPIITYEGPIPTAFKQYKKKIHPHRMHDALYYANMYIGEGGTMASEAAVLGTPAMYTNPLRMGYIAEEEEKYKLLYQNGSKVQPVLDKIDQTLETPKSVWDQRRANLLKDKIDVTAFMVWYAENYPESKQRVLEDPHIYRKFK